VAESGLGHELSCALRTAGETAIGGDCSVYGVDDALESQRHISEGNFARARDMPVLADELIRVTHIDNEDSFVAVQPALQFNEFDFGKFLFRHGFKVRRLEDGFPEWKAAGLPVAAGGGE